MKERIVEFLKRENKSSVQFAEEIGVQPSGISHILSGRNRPSLDFVLKMLERYSFISVEWLLFGQGPMYRDIKNPTLFDDIIGNEARIISETGKAAVKKVTEAEVSGANQDKITENDQVSESMRIRKIIWFFDDNSFEEFSPLKG